MEKNNNKRMWKFVASIQLYEKKNERKKRHQIKVELTEINKWYGFNLAMIMNHDYHWVLYDDNLLCIE